MRRVAQLDDRAVRMARLEAAVGPQLADAAVDVCGAVTRTKRGGITGFLRARCNNGSYYSVTDRA